MFFPVTPAHWGVALGWLIPCVLTAYYGGQFNAQVPHKNKAMPVLVMGLINITLIIEIFVKNFFHAEFTFPFTFGAYPAYVIGLCIGRKDLRRYMDKLKERAEVQYLAGDDIKERQPVYIEGDLVYPFPRFFDTDESRVTEPKNKTGNN